MDLLAICLTLDHGTRSRWQRCFLHVSLLASLTHSLSLPLPMPVVVQLHRNTNTHSHIDTDMTQGSNKSLCKEATMKTTHKNARQRLEGNKEDAKANVKEDEQIMLKICKKRNRERERGNKQNNGTSSNITHTQAHILHMCGSPFGGY